MDNIEIEVLVRQHMGLSKGMGGDKLDELVKQHVALILEVNPQDMYAGLPHKGRVNLAVVCGDLNPIGLTIAEATQNLAARKKAA